MSCIRPGSFRIFPLMLLDLTVQIHRDLCAQIFVSATPASSSLFGKAKILGTDIEAIFKSTKEQVGIEAQVP